ncbi:MAG: hypothetical protein ACOZAM_12070 [Pseudomonadota bacterium]
MNRMTITALAAVFAIAGASPVLAEGCNWTGCGKTFSIDINVDVPDNFAAATATGNFAGSANATSASVSGTSSAAAVGAAGGVGAAGNTTTAGATAESGASVSGSSTSSTSAGPATP